MRSAQVLLLFAALSLFAQKKFEEKVTVSYVEVPVTVLTRDNAPVRGLTRANFEVRDDGQRREIDSFEVIDFAAAGGTSARVISPLHPASRRNFLLLFDLSYSNPQTIVRAQEAARNFVARGIGRRDAVAVGTIDIDHGLRFLTAFTTDRTLLTAAIAQPRSFRTADPLQIAGLSTLQVVPDGMAATQQSGDPALENLRDLARGANRLDDSYNRGRLKKQVELLSDVAESLQRLAGRKHLVLLSEGFDPRLVQGRGNQAEEDQAIERGEVWKVDSDQRFGSPDTQNQLAIMAEAFKRSDVVLHAVDIQGVRVANDVKSGAKFNSNEGLFLLANSTGGTVFRNSNDITSEFDRLARQHDVVYVIGFRAPAGKAGQFHDLKVKLLNVPGARAQHRGGYYEAGPESLLVRSLTTAEVIVNDVPQDDIGLHAMAAAFPDGQVPVVMEISGPDLIRHARNNRATTDLFLYAFDEQGIVRDSIFQRITLDVSQAAKQLEGAGVRFYGTLKLPPGPHVVKSLVRVSESDQMGFQRVELDVPADGEVSMLRPLFFADSGGWVMVKATRDDPSAPYPFVLGQDAFIPAARAALRKGEPRLFTVFVYNADPKELSWEIVPAATLVSETKGDTVTKFVFALEKVPADARELAVTLRKKGSADARTMTVPIEVR